MHYLVPVPYHPCSPGALAKAAASGRASKCMPNFNLAMSIPALAKTLHMPPHRHLGFTEGAERCTKHRRKTITN